jgi:hypothetical protein
MPDEFQEAPYDYQESDTWERRRRRGATPATKPVVVGDGRRRGGRHEDNPATFSQLSSSTASTKQSSVFSSKDRDRDQESQLSEESITPSESASQMYNYSLPKNPPPKPVGPQPRPDAYKNTTTSYGIDRLAISDYNKPNQSAARQQQQQQQQQQQTASGGRHDPAKEDAKPTGRPANRTGGPRKDIYEESYH